jgi:hypothetical protein
LQENLDREREQSDSLFTTSLFCSGPKSRKMPVRANYVLIGAPINNLLSGRYRNKAGQRNQPYYVPSKYALRNLELNPNTL